MTTSDTRDQVLDAQSGSDTQQLPWDLTMDWPYAHGGPLGSAVLRTEPEDFFVDEQLGHEPTGTGEHLWLRVEKRGANTDWVAQQLARWAGVSPRVVSYAGLKDRHAVTRQSFSIQLPGKPDPDPAGLAEVSQGEFTILEQQRSSKKLQRGALAANAFVLRLRSCDVAFERLQERVAEIAQYGVPNYFGEQRFGYSNLQQAVQQLVVEGRVPRQRNRKALYFSVLRSYLFNRVLAQRVRSQQWQQVLAGEWLMLTGSNSGFLNAEDNDSEARVELEQRCAKFDVHPSGPMVGEGDAFVAADAAEFEQQQLAPYQAWIDALAQQRVEAQRRPLRLRPEQMSIEQIDDDPLIRFQLPAGSYATVVLRELLNLSDASRKPRADDEESKTP